MRVKEHHSTRAAGNPARKFAAAVIDQTRAELERLLREQPQEVDDPCRAALRTGGLIGSRLWQDPRSVFCREDCRSAVTAPTRRLAWAL